MYLKYSVQMKPQWLLSSEISGEENTSYKEQTPAKEHEKSMKVDQTPVLWRATISNQGCIIDATNIPVQQPNIVFFTSTIKAKNIHMMKKYFLDL